MTRITLALILICFLLAGCQLVPEGVTTQPLPTLMASATSLPTRTVTETQPASATVEPSPEPTLTETPEPTLTPSPTPEKIAFHAQAGTPAYLPNFAHADLGCNWLGVGGQVFSADGQPLTGAEVRVSGNLAGIEVSGSGISGLSPQYGPSGYEIELGQIAWQGIFWIELFDAQGNRLTEPFQFNTTADCQQNLAVINFAAGPEMEIFLPAIGGPGT